MYSYSLIEALWRRGVGDHRVVKVTVEGVGYGSLRPTNHDPHRDVSWPLAGPRPTHQTAVTHLLHPEETTGQTGRGRQPTGLPVYYQ